MADITKNAAHVAVLFPAHAEIYDYVAAVAVEPGDELYVNSNGKVDKADADGAAALRNPAGLALTKAGPGQAVSVLKRGAVGGFDVSGMGYHDPVYVSATPGALATTGTYVCGRIMPVSDKALTKVLYYDAPWMTVNAAT